MMKTQTSLLLVTLAACAAPEGQSWQPTIGIDTTVVDEYEFEGSIGSSSTTFDVDYSVTDFIIGATRVTHDEERPIKHEFAGMVIGTGDLTDEFGDSVDLLEISGGGAWYFDKGGFYVPYVSLYSTYSELDFPGISGQLGIRLGGGVEFPFAKNLAANLGADYLIPLIEGEDSFGIAEVSQDGLAVRVGLRFGF